MVGELLVLLYLFAAVVIGLGVFIRTLSWLSETDRVMPMVSLPRGFAWGFLAVLVAMAVEGAVLYAFWGSAMAFAILALIVGPVEEGAKLIPYFVKTGESKLYRWNLTIKTALAFGIIEGIGYFLLLFFSGNPIGAFVRLIVIAYHVVWTAIALELALTGDPVLGYLKAALIHGLYDAPAMLLLAGAGPVAGVMAIVSLGVLMYVYRASEASFRFAYYYARRIIEERLKSFESGFTSSL
ncbi:hypothetical protein [Thermococcus sp.]|jgi:hypothetical protein|uniref:hypothetical protein n=1 Tax=Thermococcus sp. TaxID=35749 RepID=UPI00261E0FDE|nr:hypothetical protein [Thermococcus sp.]